MPQWTAEPASELRALELWRAMQLLTIISSLLGDPLKRMTRRLITDGGLIMNWQFEPADVAMICETANHSGKYARVDIVLL